jgi:hypothetical protein
MGNPKHQIGVWLACAGLTLAPLSPALAHHSGALFDGTARRVLNGAVVAFDWTNPHSYLTLDVKAKSGRVQQWQIEFSSIDAMKRLGLTKDTFVVGNKVTVVVRPLRDGTTGGSFVSAVDADGKPLSRPTSY